VPEVRARGVPLRREADSYPFKGECRCGRDHTTLVREELAARGSEEGIYVPWRDEYRNWLEGERRRSEHDYWLEWRTIE
jgi:hypothetical protein